MNRILKVAAILLAWTNSLFAFSTTFPDSPVVITELPSTFTNMDIVIARNIARDSRNYIYVVYSFTREIRVSRSTDNGASWSLFATPGTQIHWADQLHGPCIAIDSGDTIYVAWKRISGDSGLTDVYWNKYAKGAWKGKERLTFQSNNERWTCNVTLTIDNRNQAHVAWDGGVQQIFDSVWYTYLDSTGQWHQPPEDVGDHQTGYSAFPFLMGDAHGNLHLGYGWFWRPPDFWRTRYRRRPEGGPWLPTEDLSAHLDSTQFEPCLTTVPGDSKPHAAFIVSTSGAIVPWNHPRLYYRNKPDTAWSQLWEIQSYRDWWYCNKPHISADREGHLYIAYRLEQRERGGGNVASRNIWVREQEYSPWWREAFKVTNDTIITGVYPNVTNLHPILGYPVTENGVDITWKRTVADTIQTQYFLMYHRLPSLLGVEQEKEKDPPREPELTLSPRPNPARGQMEIAYGIPKTENGKGETGDAKEETVNLTIYNLLGERVRTLVHGPTPAGVYRIKWNGKDERLREAPSGTYFIQLTVGEKQVIKKGTFIR